MHFQELKATGNLPSPSGVALEILRLAQNENVKLEDVVHAVSADPVLAGRVLKIANSSAYHQEQAIISIKKAIQKLGFGVLSRLALSLSTLESNKSGKCQAFDYNQFWSKSLLRALAMQAINENFKVLSTDDAFTVGLVGEIGQLALAQIYPEEFGNCLTRSFEQTSSNQFSKQRSTRPSCFDFATKQLLEEERRLFLIDHHEITLAMLNDWHLPELVVNGIDLFQQGHVLDDNTHNAVEKLASQLYFASFLAGQSTLEFGFNGIERFRDKLNIQETDLNILLKKLFEDWREWKEFLNLQPLIPPPKKSQ